MKKIFSKLMLLAMAAMTFTACEDVPEPYDKPGTGSNTVGDELAEGTYLTETFKTDFGTFKNYAIAGIPWVIDHNTAKATGYDGSSNTASEAYLVSAPINLSAATEAYVTFEYILAYTNNAGENKVLITDSFNESNVGASAWEDITGTLQGAGKTSAGKVDWNTFSTFAQNIPSKYIGKDNVRIAFYYTATDSGSRTWEVKNVAVKEGKAPEGGDTPETPAIDAVNTMETAYTVAEALNVVNGLAEGETTSKWYYLKGKVKKIATTGDDVAKYKNINYYITDDGNNEIQVYKGRNLNNTDFTADGQLNVGDEVIVVGQLMKYKNAKSGAIVPEVADGNYIVKLTPGQGGSTTPDIDAENTIETAKTVAEALNIINALGDGETTTKWYYVKGKVKNLKTKAEDISKYKNIDYYITDDGNNEIQIFRGKNLNNTDFTAEGQLNVGDEIIVVGQLMKYKNANTGAIVPEMAQGNFIVKFISRGQGGNTDPTPGGDDSGLPTPTASVNVVTNGNILILTNSAVTASASTVTYDLAQQGWAHSTEEPTVTLNDGNVISFFKGTGTTTPKFWEASNGVRMYAKNYMEIKATKAIAKIECECDAQGTTNYVGNDQLYGSVQGNTFSVVNDFTEAKGGVQLRIQKLTITYAQ